MFLIRSDAIAHHSMPKAFLSLARSVNVPVDPVHFVTAWVFRWKGVLSIEKTSLNILQAGKNLSKGSADSIESAKVSEIAGQSILPRMKKSLKTSKWSMMCVFSHLHFVSVCSSSSIGKETHARDITTRA